MNITLIKNKLFNKATLAWLAITVGLFGLANAGVIPTTTVEIIGFVSGALCVWLLVKQNIWNWPLGILNATMFIILFYQAGLYADMALQVMYIVLGFFGWYWWLKGGANHSELQVQRTSKKHGLLLLIIAIIATYGMYVYLVRINDSAPFLDALTTVMSLTAQYMLTRKLIENWAVWIAADIIYIGLYTSRGLYLTSVLYAVFLSLCIAGAIEWRKSLQPTVIEAGGEL
jgi:nicotinamide mononucleotide transporter